MDAPKSPLLPGPAVASVSELVVGDLLFDGSETHSGEPNLLVVSELCLSPPALRSALNYGIQGHFVSLSDPTEKRLPDDRTFFVWGTELARRPYRRAVTGPWPVPPGPLGRVSPLAS
jgi:hypothetical protein